MVGPLRTIQQPALANVIYLAYICQQFFSCLCSPPASGSELYGKHSHHPQPLCDGVAVYQQTCLQHRLQTQWSPDTQLWVARTFPVCNSQLAVYLHSHQQLNIISLSVRLTLQLFMYALLQVLSSLYHNWPRVWGTILIPGGSKLCIHVAQPTIASKHEANPVIIFVHGFNKQFILQLSSLFYNSHVNDNYMHFAGSMHSIITWMRD